MAIIYGTPDSDFLFGEAGDDTIFGGPDESLVGTGDDFLFGGDGNDTLNGGDGTDLLLGEAGDDTLNGGDGSDFLLGEAGNDTLHGGADDDFLDGGLDNDTLFGDAGNDSLMGDAGNDTLVGGAGNDTLNGGLGADVFKFSFALTPGQGSSSTFTEWLSEKFGKDFGDHLPDYAPAHKHHHHQHDKDDKHGKDDKHHSKDDDHGKNDQHDKHGKDDGHHSKGDHHAKNDKHGGDDGHHAPAGGLTENFFEKNYKEWLKEVVVADLLEQGFVLDANGNGKIKIDINEDSRNGTPRIEGLTKDQLAEIFGDRDSVILRDGHETEKAWYSNSYTSPGGGQDSVASTDGFDTIVGFDFAEDTLDFNGLGAGFTLADFTSLFTVSNVDTGGAVGADSTMLALADGTWGVTLQDVLLDASGSTIDIDDFYSVSVFS